MRPEGLRDNAREKGYAFSDFTPGFTGRSQSIKPHPLFPIRPASANRAADSSERLIGTVSGFCGGVAGLEGFDNAGADVGDFKVGNGCGGHVFVSLVETTKHHTSE